MKLVQYRVTNFRSVTDSDWIKVEDITALIGENETGKTNLLLPLWKFNPVGNAPGSEINILADMPQARFAEMRNEKETTAFITAEFECDESDTQKLAGKSYCEPEALVRIIVTRNYDGSYGVEFPLASNRRFPLMAPNLEAVQDASRRITELEAARRIQANSEEDSLAGIYQAVLSITSAFKSEQYIRESDLTAGRDELRFHIDQIPDEITRNKLIELIMAGYDTALQKAIPPQALPGVEQQVRDLMPRFIYYSNYGALDSRIYLPRVIEDMKRPASGLDKRQGDQARTLGVLFKYVGIPPEEILSLGQEPPQAADQVNSQELTAMLSRKEERRHLMEFRPGAGWMTDGPYTSAEFQRVREALLECSNADRAFLRRWILRWVDDYGHIRPNAEKLPEKGC